MVAMVRAAGVLDRRSRAESSGVDPGAAHRPRSLASFCSFLWVGGQAPRRGQESLPTLPWPLTSYPHPLRGQPLPPPPASFQPWAPHTCCLVPWVRPCAPCEDTNTCLPTCICSS